ncbi:MAG TPA: hypothetical protein DDW65_08965 [Firmicutes bacterium]|nr:hypothetical protein [Bacillota bacterium]
MGNENLNGHDYQDIQYTYEEKKFEVMVQWIANKLGFVVRTLIKDAKGKETSTMDYTNIKPGGQANSLFEIPEGY